MGWVFFVVTFMYTFFCVCMRCAYVGATVYVGRSEDSCGSLLSPSTTWAPDIKQVISSAASTFHTLSHLAGPTWPGFVFGACFCPI